MSTSKYKGKRIFVTTAGFMGGRDAEMTFGIGHMQHLRFTVLMLLLR